MNSKSVKQLTDELLDAFLWESSQMKIHLSKYLNQDRTLPFDNAENYS